MDEAWERVVEAAIDGQGTPSSELRVLNLDGAVKSLHGCLPPAGLLERFPCLEQLSIANVGALSLDSFPRLRNLQRLILSDNRIAGGLENLVKAGLHSLRDLDLSNNRIQFIDDLIPLSNLHLVSLDLYECPVTRVTDYRTKVFGMIRSLKYLDKLDANEDERPESDDEEEDDEEYDYDDCDPGSGEVDGDDRAGKLVNGAGDFADVDDVIVDADEDEESDADEEEMETSGRGAANGTSSGSGRNMSNGYRVTSVGAISVEGNQNDADEEDVEVEDDDDNDDDDDDDDDLGEEIDEEEGEDTDAVEVHDVLDSDEEDEDGVDDVEEDEEDIDEEDGDNEDEEDDDEVDEDEDEVAVEDDENIEPGNSGRFVSAEGEIDAHEHGEEDENGEIGMHDENGEIGEEDELQVEDRDVDEDFGDGEDEDDLDGDYLVQHRPNGEARSEFDVANEIDDDLDEDDDNLPRNGDLRDAKRRRDEEGDLDDDDYTVKELRPSKRW